MNIDNDLLVRLVCLACGVLLLISALAVSAIRKSMIDGVLGFVTGLCVIGLIAVGAFGAVAVGNAIPIIVLIVLMLAVSAAL